MKVILTAFVGTLRSAVLDWPEQTAPRIKLPMTMSKLRLNEKGFDRGGMDEIPGEKMIGEFESTGKFYPLKDGESAAEYALISIV